MTTIDDIKKQELELQFESFDNYVAFKIGAMLQNKAIEGNLPIAINITKNNQNIFHIAMPFATLNNEHWLRRKVNTAYHFQASSYRIQLECEKSGESLSDKHALSQFDYASAGGAFPINVKGAGMVGTIAVSGLTSEEDHALIVDCIKEYLKIN